MGIVALAVAVLGSACGGGPSPSVAPTVAASTTATPAIQATSSPRSTERPETTPAATALVLPPADASFDYQLGGAYPPPEGVTIVSRDRTEAPEPGLYNICYINGFQIQPGEEGWWEANHPDAILRDKDGKAVIDPDWDETMLAPTTPQRRTELAGVIGEWIANCAADGFDAVEIDNLDTFTRSHGLITEDDAVAQMRLFAEAAHAVGLPIAQKNSAEIVGRAGEMGTDFAVAEECDRYDECDAYTAGYGDHVLVIEYRRRDFEAGCKAFPDLSIVLRDLDLVPKGDKGYVFDAC
jgi:hypothetical protein